MKILLILAKNSCKKQVETKFSLKYFVNDS